jgi:allophanate hydrolase
MSAVQRVRECYRRIAEVDRPEVWITLRPRADAVADAERVDAALAAGVALPLAGLTLAVKDNIDVAGLPTTAACPAFASVPAVSAPAVDRLVAAGAIVVGKTNLDQFATGLAGTRSPYGAVRDARRPDHVAGGSSSGSAVAVALGLVDVALGTDTAGSGRVPAAFQGVVGLKPTRGLVPTAGVVPASRSFDCVSVFARTVAAAERVLGCMVGPHPGDPLCRRWPADAPLAAPPAPTVAVPRSGQLDLLTPSARPAFAAVLDRLEGSGAVLDEIDVAVFLEAGDLLYDGAFVAERHAAVGAFAARHPEAVDPVVGAILAAAGRVEATRLVRDAERLARLRQAAHEVLAGRPLLMPTAPRQPTIAEVQRDPVGANTALGRYTRFANLLDLCAVAVPAGEADGGRFGVSVLAPAFADRVAADVARLAIGEPDAPAWPADGVRGPRGIDVLVVGAHLAGQPLNVELVRRGARFAGHAATAASYRLLRLETDPPKPGLVRTSDGGESIVGELWTLPPAGLGTLAADLPAPMALGSVRLADRREVVGFLCEPCAVEGAEDITEHGGWRAYLTSQEAVSA